MRRVFFQHFTRRYVSNIISTISTDDKVQIYMPQVVGFVEYTSMIGENRQLLTDEPVEFEK